MHYMVTLFFYTHNFVIEEVLHYIKELYKFSHKWIKNTLHSFSHGLINFRECPTWEPHKAHISLWLIYCQSSWHIKYVYFHMICLVAQENVVLSKCHILHHMSYYRGFQENGPFRCKISFCIHNEDTYVWKNIFIREICSKCHTIWS